jgi:uncharacterized membrane protein YfcA
MEILGYVASVFVGLVLGLLGGGGSILSIPILVYLFHIEPIRASAYSLFIVGITSLIGAVPKYREKLIDFRSAVLFGLPSILAIFSTRKWVVPLLPEVIATVGDFEITRRMLLLGLFAILMLFAALPMIRKTKGHSDGPKGSRTLLIIVQGLWVGFLTGLVGAGGGFLIIPALVFLAGLPFKTAAGTSLVIIAVNSLIGFFGDMLNYTMDWPFLITIASLAIVGIFIGNRASRHVDGQTLKQAFGWLILITGLYILSKEFL